MLAAILRNLAVGVLVASVLLQGAIAQGPGRQPALGAVDIEQFLPVASVRLSVGPFEAIQRSTGVLRPFFLIGCDAVSLEWLHHNQPRLLALNAFGLVVDAPDAAAYRALASAAAGLILRPVAGDLIAEHLKIEHYPALITAEGIFP